MSNKKEKAFLEELKIAISQIKKGEVSELKREDLLKLTNSNEIKTKK